MKRRMHVMALVFGCLVVLFVPHVACAQEPSPSPSPSTPSPSPSPSAPGDVWIPGVGTINLSVDAWVNAPLDTFLYDRYRQLAQASWQFTGSNFQFVDTTAQLRERVLRIFEPLLNTTGNVLLDLATQILIMALVLAGVLLIARPITQVQVVNLRAATWMLVLLPILLPIAGTGYAASERWRNDLAETLYVWFFDDLRTNYAAWLTPAAPPAPVPPDEQPMASITPFLPEPNARPSLDIAAAYVWAAYPDLQTVEQGLPVQFTTQYFSATSDELKTVDSAQRAAALDTAWLGVRRMSSGGIVSILPVADETLRAVWWFGTTTLFVAAVLTAMWALFSPARRLLVVLVHECCTVWLLSWAFSLVQAFFVALVYQQAVAGSVGNLVASSLLATGVIALLIVAAVAVVGLGLLHAVQVTTDDNKLAQRFNNVMRRGHTRPRSATSERADARDGEQSAASTMDRALTYAGARRQGASRAWAGAYALSTVPSVQRSASVLMALGGLPNVVEHGVVAGVVHARGQLGGLRGQTRLRTQVVNWREHQQQHAQVPDLLGMLAGVRVAQQHAHDHARERALDAERERLRQNQEWAERMAQKRAQRNGQPPGQP